MAGPRRRAPSRRTRPDSIAARRRRCAAPHPVRRRSSRSPHGRAMITLVLDASTYTGTVAVLEDQRLVIERAATMRGRDSERLMPTVDSVLREAGRTIRDVHRVVCGGGPGSFTS